MSEGNGRQVCLMLLSCVGVGPRYLLPLSDEFHRRYKFVTYVNNYAPSIPGQMVSLEQEIAGASVLIHHNPDWLPWLGDKHEEYEATLARVPGNVMKMSYPLPHFHALWPFHTNDTRNDDSARQFNRHGDQPVYHYGDSYVIELLKQEVLPEEILSRYLSLDVSTVVDLDQLMSSALSMIERCDRTCDIKAADFISTEYRVRKVFQTINHGTNLLHFYLTNEILKLLDCAPLPKIILDQTCELIGGPMPIHPSIARHFGLTYADETTRYPLDEFRNLTFAEYISRYIYFT
jgi:hypothetical protein